MITGYARSYVDFWTGSTGIKMASCGDEGVRSLAHFLFSGPNCMAWGLYYKPLESVTLEFKRPAPGQHLAAEKQVRGWMKILAELDFAYHDDPSGFIWVKEMAAKQFHPLPLKGTNLLIKSARRWYAHLSRNPFLGPFYDRYDIDLHLSNPFAFPGSQVERREWASRAPEQPALIDVERRTPAEVKKLEDPPAGEIEFESWWQAYPKHRRVERKVALDVWKRKRIPRSKLPEIMAMLEQQKASNDWRKDGGQYVPRAAKYLKNERYNDEHTGDAAGGLNSTNQATADTLAELYRDEEFK